MRASLIAAILCVSAGVAAADVDCSFLGISATKDKTAKVDPELQPLQKKLQKAPFSSWNVFHVLSSATKKLSPNKPEHPGLKKGTATVMLRGQKASIQLDVQLDDAAGKRIIDTKPDVPSSEWFVVGTSVKDDGYLFALSCK